MSEIVLLRASLPAAQLAQAFLDAIARNAEIDLVVEGRRARLLPEVARRLTMGGRDAVAAMTLGAALFPKVIGLLVQSRRFGRTWSCRQVAGAREVVLEIRRAG
ncbi:hypothetical protein [Vulgatibacter sp.]|uniref:hypothetical protein n=1 Tax=Vulgatibacter sp. TaxID=1971226 RepID=UPI0035697733